MEQNNNTEEPFGRRIDTKDIATALESYNAWRRGAATEQPDPTELGRLLDAAIKRLRELDRVSLDSAEVEGISFSPNGGNKFLALCRDGFKKCGIAMERVEPDGRVTRAWVGAHGMVLWPRTECEAGIERAKVADLQRWKDAVEDALVVCGILSNKHLDDPRAAVQSLEAWNASVALDPLVSQPARDLHDRINALEKEVTHWKANHANEVKRARILKERTDMPMERVAAYHQWESDLASLFKMTAEVKRLRALKFPAELRKMWSGSEVQEWLNQNLAS